MKLYITITNKETDKNSNFKVNLENGFISEIFLKKLLLKGIQENYISKFNDVSEKTLFNIYEIYEKVKKNPQKGEVLSIDNDKVSVAYIY